MFTEITIIDDYETIKLLSKQFQIYEQEIKIKFESESLKLMNVIMEI